MKKKREEVRGLTQAVVQSRIVFSTSELSDDTLILLLNELRYNITELHAGVITLIPKKSVWAVEANDKKKAEEYANEAITRRLEGDGFTKFSVVSELEKEYEAD